jgi:hypothetical protein
MCCFACSSSSVAQNCSEISTAAIHFSIGERSGDLEHLNNAEFHALFFILLPYFLYVQNHYSLQEQIHENLVLLLREAEYRLFNLSFYSYSLSQRISFL